MKSLGPASIKRTFLSGRYSESREAMTQPAVPPPTMTKSHAALEGMVVVVGAMVTDEEVGETASSKLSCARGENLTMSRFLRASPGRNRQQNLSGRYPTRR